MYVLVSRSQTLSSLIFSQSSSLKERAKEKEIVWLHETMHVPSARCEHGALELSIYIIYTSITCDSVKNDR